MISEKGYRDIKAEFEKTYNHLTVTGIYELSRRKILVRAGRKDGVMILGSKLYIVDRFTGISDHFFPREGLLGQYRTNEVVQ